MIGAIIGDIVGSRFEFDNFKLKDFEMFDTECDFTDDSVMTLAIAKALQSYETITDMEAFKKHLVKVILRQRSPRLRSVRNRITLL